MKRFVLGQFLLNEANLKEMSLVEKLSNENSQVCSIVVIIPVTIKSSGAIFGR